MKDAAPSPAANNTEALAISFTKLKIVTRELMPIFTAFHTAIPQRVEIEPDGTFSFEAIITNQPGIEPNNWTYTIKFSWNVPTIVVTPVAGAGSQNITALVVPAD